MSWIDDARSRLPDAQIEEFRWVYGNTILVDVIPESSAELLSSVSFTVPVQLLPLAPLAKILHSQIDLHSYERILWPGTGAITVQKLLKSESFGERVDARRVGYKNPRVEIGELKPQNVRTLIVDDVVCSGATVRGIQEKVEASECDVACLVMQYPRDTKLMAFRRLFAPLMIRGEHGKVPLNSLSTFLKNREIAEDYGRRFALDSSEFLEALSLIKEEVAYYA